jgi:transposase
VWASLKPKDRKTQRKPIAEKLYKQGFTMEVIARQLGVSHITIKRDLSGLDHHDTNPPRPKGGRPKGTATPKKTERHKKIIELSDGGESPANIASKVGVTRRQVDQVLLREKIKRETEAQTRADVTEDQQLAGLSEKSKMTVQRAIDIHKRRLNKEFETRVNAEVRHRIDDANDHLRRSHSELSRENTSLKIQVQRQTVYTRSEFNLLLLTAHPDNSASPETRAKSLHLLKKNERRLVGFNGSGA